MRTSHDTATTISNGWPEPPPRSTARSSGRPRTSCATPTARAPPCSSAATAGSASMADHMACDHLKGVQTDTPLLPRVVSLSANVALLTAVANDIAFEDVFLYPLRTMARSGDVLVTVSASGDSENVVRAAAWAREQGARGHRPDGLLRGPQRRPRGSPSPRGRLQLRGGRGRAPVDHARPRPSPPPGAHARRSSWAQRRF